MAVHDKAHNRINTANGVADTITTTITTDDDDPRSVIATKKQQQTKVETGPKR